MGKFYNRIDALGRIFRLDAGAAFPTQLDTNGPIQAVEDVSRLAELGDGPSFFGYNNFSLPTTHAVVGSTEVAAQDTAPAALFWGTMGVSPRTHWLWMTHASIRIGDGLSFTDATLWLDQGTSPPFGFTTHQIVTHFWDVRLSRPLGAGFVPGSRLNSPSLIPCPILIPDNGILRFNSTAAGAVEQIICQVQVAVVPKGVGPHGLY